MSNEMADFQTPGQYIQSLLAERGWTQEVLANVMDVSIQHVSRIVNDRVSLDAEKSLVLAEVFGTEPEELLALQAKYDLAQARLRQRPDPKRALRAKLYAHFPIAEMIRRGWIDAESPKDTERVEAALARFFGVASADQIPDLPHAAKKSSDGGELTSAQLVWIHRVRSIAGQQIVGRYSPANVRAAVDRLAELRTTPEGIRKVPRVLAEAGVRFVVVQALPASKIDGVCFWLNDMAPVIGMTLRYDRIDNFWFVLRHECEHVLRGHGRRRERIDVELEGERAGTDFSVPEEERMANEAASNFCVPSEQMDRFYTRKYPYFMKRDLLGFAATVKVHPGLVVGQLQRRIGRYDRFREYLVKVGEIVRSSAAVDGWGQVYAFDSNL
jgi:HTH-type transcriptional regulator / antitoxin HigA